MYSGFHCYPLVTCFSQINQYVAVQLHGTVGHIVHPCQSQPYRFGQIPLCPLFCLQLVLTVDIDGLKQIILPQWTKQRCTIVHLVAGHEYEFGTDLFARLRYPYRSLHIHSM